MSFGIFSTDFTRQMAPLSPHPTNIRVAKRKPPQTPLTSTQNRANRENATPNATPAGFSSTPLVGTKRRAQEPIRDTPDAKRTKGLIRTTLEIPWRMDLRAKRRKILELLQVLDLTLGETFTLLLTKSRDPNSQYYISEQADANVIQAYLCGKNQKRGVLHTPGAHIKLMYNHEYGQPYRTKEKWEDFMFASKEQRPYDQIRHVRAALSSFAFQTMAAHFVGEIKKAVQEDAGLHVSHVLPATQRTHENRVYQWADIGAESWNGTQRVIQAYQPILRKLLRWILSAKERKSTRRPIDGVVTLVISVLDFTFNQQANLFPSALGLLYLAYSAPVDLFALSSRLGIMPAYPTVLTTAKGLASTEKKATFHIGRRSDSVLWMQIDNSQSYVHRRHERFGRDNQMMVGISGVLIECDEPAEAADLDAKDRIEAEGTRSTLTVRHYANLLNFPHLDGVYAAHWLKVLVDHIPELRIAENQQHIKDTFRIRLVKLKKADTPSKIHPLSSCSKNENVTGELKEGLRDFLAQVGQLDGDYSRGRYIRLGGDGLTFERTLQLSRYLQFDDDDLHNLRILDPVLAPWHTLWTFQSALFVTHYGSNLSTDPSTLGHSANAINRKQPPNLSKVDYYAGKELLDTVLDARMLDVWRNHFKCADIFAYFKALHASGKVPSMAKLEQDALYLHGSFSTTHAYYQAARDASSSSAWTSSVPEGTSWPVPPINATTGATSRKPKNLKGKGKQPDPTWPSPYQGDYVLVSSIVLLRDGILVRECEYSMAEGDVGRMWEVMKMFLFIFAGSNNSKYVTYLLETICALEFESTRAQRQATLRGMVANISGHEGHHAGIDLLLEHFNRLLEAIISKKGQEFGASFIRNVISPNVHHFSRIKTDMRQTVGLATCRGRHTHPDCSPEISKLLDVYREHQLHLRRPGRHYAWRQVERFEKGYKALAGNQGRVKKWVQETTRMSGVVSELQQATARGTQAVSETTGKTTSRAEDDDSHSDEDSEEEEEGKSDDDGGEPEDILETDEAAQPDFHNEHGRIRLMLPPRMVDGSIVAVDVDDDTLLWQEDDEMSEPEEDGVEDLGEEDE
ncbi:hypothetical protein C8F01DRAFT_1371370 [Mycena amicta]|nr:hypothetical protein C8F01DRAFT_1371370 [Mycena amicta]